MNSPSNVDRNRLRFKSWNRGTQESDLLLGRFADSCLADLDASQLNRFEALLDCSDPSPEAEARSAVGSPTACGGS